MTKQSLQELECLEVALGLDCIGLPRRTKSNGFVVHESKTFAVDSN